MIAPPGDAAVHVWHARWDHAGDGGHALRAWALPMVNAAERARADRRATALLQSRQLAASAMTRAVLAGYLDADPGSLAFESGAHGKPELARSAWRWLRYNLSHSGDAIVVAVAVERAVGVDVEHVADLTDVEHLAERVLTPAERAIVLARPAGGERQRAFYRLWTLKEAYLKGVGTGITVPFHRVEVELATAGPRLTRGLDDAHSGNPPGWSLAELTLAPDVVGAVALAGPLAAVDLREFRPPGAGGAWPEMLHLRQA